MLAQFDAGKAEPSRWLIPFTQFLRDSGRLDPLGGVGYVTTLATVPIADTSVPFFAQILREKYVLRELIALGTKLVRASYGAVSDEAGDILDDFTRWLEHIKEDALSGLNGAPWQDPQPLPDDIPAVPAFIRPKRHDDWLELANLWGCIIGRVGLLKTPALQQAPVPLRRLSHQAFEQYEAEMRDYKASEMLRAQSKRNAEKEIRQLLKDGKKDEALEAAQKHLADVDEKPICRRYEVNNATIEKLGELLSQNPNGLLLVRDELNGFVRSLDREDRAGDRAAYLEMWDGKGELTYDRIERGTIRIQSNTLSILGTIQPDVLVAYVLEAVRGGSGNDGLLQRMQLFVWPDVLTDWVNVDEWPETIAKNQAFDVFEYLDQLDPEEVNANVEEAIPFLRFSNDAQERFDVWRASLEKKLRSGDEHPAFEAHLAKYRKLVPALALLIHLAQRNRGTVSSDALNKALLWADYLEAHARRIYSAVLHSDTTAARELAKHLQRGDLPERFKLRDVYRKGWAGLSSKEDAEAATEILCDLNWIRSVEVRQTSGRPASATFEVNPKIPK
jgi:hypothetical protein